MNLPRYITQLTKEWIAEVSKRLDAGNCINLKDAGESRIIDVDVDALKLQIGGGGGGSVTSVDDVSPTTGSTNVALNALRNDENHQVGAVAGAAAYLDVGETGGVQEYSSKLDNIQSYIDNNGKVLLSGIHGNIDGHSGNCLVTIDKDGNLGHSKNKAYALLVGGAADTTKNANKIITDKDIGNGLEADSSYNLQVKCATNGGITADANGIALGGFSGTNKWVKTDGSGKITTTDDVPITASTTATGVVYNDKGSISYKAINIARGVAGTDENNKIKLAQIPTGTSESSVALGNHAHAYNDGSLTGFGDAAAKNVGVSVNDVAAGLHMHGNITADGKLNGCSSANCFLVTTTDAVITHSNLAPKVSDVKDLVTQWINADKELGAVASVCGKTGAVTLDNSDVGAAATNHNHTTGDITDFSSSVQSLINSALTSYATQSWVTSQLSDKASQSSVDTLTDSLESLTAIVQQISSDYVTSTDLASYATQEWVQSQGYVTDEEIGEYLTTEDISQDSINALASGVSSSTLNVVGEVTWNGSDLQYKYKEVTITKGVITNVPASYTTKTIDTPTVITWS